MSRMTENIIDYRQIVEDFYVGHIKNRLRELETADDDEQTRWVWELIQNAKDCSKEIVDISKLTCKFKPVDIEIDYDAKNKKVIFKHNGYPFTNETLNSLMYKYSSKNGKEESTGRFGTGFMTSHTLSRIVYIKAPFLFKKDDSYELQYVETTVFREGSNEDQLRIEFKKMEKSRKFSPYNPNDINHKWTTFTYFLNNDIGIHSANLGIQSLNNNIKKVFLLCDRINSIRLNNKELINLSMISKNRLQISNNQNYFIIEKNCKDEKFIIASYKEKNQQYLKKYSKDQGVTSIDKYMFFNIVVSVNSNHQIINKNNDEICLFCTFPLIGSEECQLPYIINCPIFETSTERKGLILDGDEEDSAGILTNTGLNRLILNKSIDLFSIVVDYLVQNNYSNFASFASGVQLNIKQMNPFILKIRSILEKKPIVRDSNNKFLPLNEIIFLDFNNIKDKRTFYDLSSLFLINIANYDECIAWNNKTWSELSVLNIDSFVKNILCIENINFYSPNFVKNKELFVNGLYNLSKNDFSFLNRFYSFLLNEEAELQVFTDIAHNSQFLKEKIILNSNCEFVYLIDLKSNSKFTNDLNTIMEQCKSWKDGIIHPEIKSFKSIIPEVTIDDAIQQINHYVSNNKEDISILLSFVKFVLKDDKHREKMYQIASIFYEMPQKIIVTNVDQNIWEKVDYYLLMQIKEKYMMKPNTKIAKSSLKNYNKFYKLYQKVCGKTDFLVPNYNLVLTDINELKSLSKDIPQVLLDTIVSFYNFDIYIHPSINSVTLKKSVDDLDYFINLFKSEEFFYSKDKIIKEKLFAILKIVPPENKQRLYNFQLKISKIAQFFFNENINEIKSNIKDETFWETANEIVVEYISDILTDCKTIKNLQTKLNKNEDNIFLYLNYFYSIISTNFQEQKETIRIPNYNGTFLPANCLFISKGLNENLYDLINKANNEFDIKEIIAHSKIQCNFLKIMDFEYFIKLLNEKLSEDQLVNDKIIVDAIVTDLSIFNEQSKHIFERLYVANIKNRLNEIQNPTDIDKIRWPMELMQNAKDSLFSPSNLNQQKDVEINIEVSFNIIGHPKEVIFSHNGPAFTENSICGLLYKICEDKNNPKSTGKFGTGFISTHVLSKIVKVSGNIIDKQNKVKGFSVTLYREGIKDQEIISDYKKMQHSFKFSDKINDLTKFEYIIESNSRECVKLGLNHFKKHISNVLINCKEIKCVNLFENKKKTTYTASREFKKCINSFKFYKYKTCANDKLLQQFFVVKNEDKITIAIEFDNNKNKIIPRDKDEESLFAVFPLVGSKAHILPFILNSSNLNPVTERNALILHGKEVINGEITDCGKNRTIILKSISLFEQLIQLLKESKCTNMHELTYGLLLSNMPYESFDLKWYNDIFLAKCKEIILNNIEVKTYFRENLLLKEIIFPPFEFNDEFIERYINLASRFFKNIICVKDALLWRNRIWKTIQTISIGELINHVTNDLSLMKEKKLSFLNEFLSFIWKFDKNLLYNYSIIPDMNGNFHSLTNDSNNLRECKTVSNQIIEIMELIEIPWKSTHMHNLIKEINLSEDKMIDAENRIIEKINQNNELSIKLMKFVLKKNDLRRNMFDLVNEIKLENFKNPIIVNNINHQIWEFADKFVLKQIIKKIKFFNSENVKNHIDFFKKFLSVFFNIFSGDKELIKSSIIFPNANCKLKKLDDLYKKSDSFHDFLNPIMINYFKCDFNERIFHPQIAQLIETNKEESITDFLIIINEKIKNLNTKDKIKTAESVISIVPTNKNHNSILDEPKQIFSLYHDLINPNIKEFVIDEKFYEQHYWKLSKDIIISIICEKIELSKSLKNFQKDFNFENEDEAFKMLNLLYKFDQNHKIIPNKVGDFMYKKNLKIDPNIDNDLLECFLIMDPETKLIKESAHQKVKINGLLNFDIIEIMQLFNQLYKSTNAKDKVNQKIKEICIENPLFISSNEKSNDYLLRIEMLQSGHIDYLKNRIRDLDNANCDDFKRWPFELIQNANDCVRDTTQKVTMTFEFEDHYVNFIHNGTPFNNRTLYALLYQCSEGKDENSLKVGRFGTGFMATHILSRVIHISGDLETDERIKGFEVTINREGSKRKELKDGIAKMEKSKKIEGKAKGFTKFQYDLSNIVINGDSSNAKAYKQGFLALISNIPQVLIFNHSIESITVKNKNTIIKYVANHENGHIQTVISKSNQNKIKTQKFILFKNEEDVKIYCLLQINDYNIVKNNYSDFLYLSYPIFGYNHFYSPIIINSPDFEPDKERKKLFIQENMKSIEEGEESLKNKRIISKSVNIFKNMIQYVIDKKYSNLFNLCNGLKYDSDIKFIQNNFIKQLRKIILSYPVFRTSAGSLKFNDIIIPYINNYDEFTFPPNEKEHKFKELLFKEFYKLVSKLSMNSKLVIYNDCIQWNQLLWDDFKSKFDVISFIKYISNFKNINELPIKRKESKYDYINNVIIFIEKMDECENILQKYKILINMNGDLMNKNDIYYFDLSKEFIEMLDIVQYNYNSIILHKCIEHIYFNEKIKLKKFGILDAISLIKNNINVNNAVNLTKFVIKDDQIREKIYFYTQKILGVCFNKVYINFTKDYSSTIKDSIFEMFQKVDSIVLKQLIEKIQNNFDIEKNILTIKEFVQLLNEVFKKNEFENEKIIPNQNFQLCLMKNLYKDGIHDENLMNSLNTLFNYDIKNILVHQYFVTIEKYETICYSNLSNIIINLLKENDIFETCQIDRIKFYSIFLQNTFSKDTYVQSIIKLFNFFFNEKIEQKLDLDFNCIWSAKITDIIQKMIIEDITLKISLLPNIKSTISSQEELDILYKILSILYNFTTNNKIFPNIYGNFKYKNEIKLLYEPAFNYKDLLKLMNFFGEFEEIIDSILCPSIEISNENIRKQFEIINMKYIHDKIKLIIQKNPENDYEEFFKFIDLHKSLKANFSDIIDDQKEKIPLEVLGNILFYKNIVKNHYQTYDKNQSHSYYKYQSHSYDKNQSHSYDKNQSHSYDKKEKFTEKEYYYSNGINVLVVYEEMKKSKKFSLIKWLALSDVKTNLSFEMNEKKYYIKENFSEPYDIYAEDFQNNKYHVAVKSDMFKPNKQHFNFPISENSIYYFAYVENASNNPRVMWLKIENQL